MGGGIGFKREGGGGVGVGRGARRLKGRGLGLKGRRGGVEGG